jgi:predicted negative regulator of RcsB-dependent stress response
MKPIVFVYSLIFIFVVGFACMSNFAHGQEMSSKRWDVQMIEDAPIWHRLRIHYFDNPVKKYWPERKAALQTIINQFPASRGADDAALMLAGGQASIEGDRAGALITLGQVMANYQDGNTVVVGWAPDIGCALDRTWLETIVLLSPTGSVSESRPFDRYGGISKEDLERLAYFEHLEKYPRRTIDVAQLVSAQIRAEEGDFKGAIAELEALIARSANLRQVVATDQQFAVRSRDTFTFRITRLSAPIRFSPLHVRGIARPQYSAYRYLMHLYQSQKDVKKAMVVGLELANIASPDGREWFINEEIGNLLAKNGRWAKAAEQYQLAVNAYREFVEENIVERELANQSLPSGATSWRQQVMKTSIGHQLTVLEKLLTEAKAKREEAKTRSQAPSEISPSRN